MLSVVHTKLEQTIALDASPDVVPHLRQVKLDSIPHLTLRKLASRP